MNARDDAIRNTRKACPILDALDELVLFLIGLCMQMSMSVHKRALLEKESKNKEFFLPAVLLRINQL